MDTRKIISIFIAFLLLLLSVIISSSLLTVNKLKDSFDYVVIGKYLRYPNRPGSVVYHVRDNSGIEGEKTGLGRTVEVGNRVVKKRNDPYLYITTAKGEDRTVLYCCIKLWHRENWAWPKAWKDKWPEATCKEESSFDHNFLGWICFGILVYQFGTWWQERQNVVRK